MRICCGPGGKAGAVCLAPARALLTFDAHLCRPAAAGSLRHRVDAMLGTVARWRGPAALMGLGVADARAASALVVGRAVRRRSVTADLRPSRAVLVACAPTPALVPLALAAAWRLGATLGKLPRRRRRRRSPGPERSGVTRSGGNLGGDRGVGPGGPKLVPYEVLARTWSGLLVDERREAGAEVGLVRRGR